MGKRDMTSVVYTDDEGNDYAMKIDAATFAQVGASTNPKVGGADYTGSPALPPMPRNLRPRTVTVSNAGDKRRVICLEPTADLFTAVETTINLQQLGSAALTYTRTRKTAERYSRGLDPSD